MLKYPPFLAISNLVTTAHGGSIVKKGNSGPAVAVVQAAMLDLGAKMPKTSAHGSADGIFGYETLTAVKAFQAKQKLVDDGVVGKQTLLALDKLMAAQVAKQPPAPAPSPAYRPPPRDANYVLGTQDPALAADRGAGAWNSRPKTATYCALKLQIVNILPHAFLLIGDDAAKHMAHYFGNTGRPLKLDVESMLTDVESARVALEAEAMQAQDFVSKLPPGRHSITSRDAEGGYNEKSENWNWFFATGGYVSWGKGDVVIQAGATGREYEMDFEYKVFDRYNWDKGKQVTILGITVTDVFMGEFHRQGLAREFDCSGSVRRKLKWKQGEMLSEAQLRQAATSRS